MRAVNLLPRDLQYAKSIRNEDPAVVVGSALGVVVMIALGGAFMNAHSKANAQEARLTQARLQLAQLSQQKHPQRTTPRPQIPITPIVPPPAVTGQEATWLSAVSSVLSQRIAWDRVLREVSLVIPDDVTLESLTMTSPTGAAAAPAAGAPAPTQGFVISGSAYSYDSVARLLSRLALVPDLTSVTLTGSNQGTSSSSSSSGDGADTSGGAVQFNISAAIKGAAPAAAATPTAPAVTDTSATTTTGVSS
jgi:Tfp pilus assembly protein PilN